MSIVRHVPVVGLPAPGFFQIYRCGGLAILFLGLNGKFRPFCLTRGLKRLNVTSTPVRRKIITALRGIWRLGERFESCRGARFTPWRTGRSRRNPFATLLSLNF